MSTSFAVGRRWFCDPKNGRARFWFVIIGPATLWSNKTHKLCRLEVHPDDIAAKAPGYKHHGIEQHYSHKHLKQHAVLAPLQ